MLVAAAFLSGHPVSAQTYLPPASPRATFNFNPGWKLFVGNPAGAQTNGFDDSAWKSVALPHAWNEDYAFQVAIGSLPTGIAWYRKHFVLPPGSSGEKVFLEFEGIRQAGEVYINGQWVGRSENGVMAFGLDITTNLLAYPQDNVVAVRTDNSYSYTEIATGVAFEWNSTTFYANYGGINKNVWLHFTGKTYQTLPLFSNLGTVGTYVYGQNYNVPGRSAVIHADTQVRNEDAAAHTLSYQVVIVDTNGVALTNFQGTSMTIQPGQTNVLTASSLVTNLNFWSWGYGYLYDVYTILSENNNVLDVVRTRTGFRKTAFTNGMVVLNDRAINIHGYGQRSTDEWPAIGCSVPTWMDDFSQKMVVDGGGNNMRWMHVTPGKQIIEACDRQGLMMVMPAGDQEGDVTGRQWDQRTELMRDAIIFNKNDPSIIFYECGNQGIIETQMVQMKGIRNQYDPYGGRAIGAREMMGSTNAEYGGEMLYIDKSGTKPMWMMEYDRDEDLRRYWDNYSPPYHQDGDYVHRNMDSMAIQNVNGWNDYYVQRPGSGVRVNAGGVKIIFSDSNTHFRGDQNYRGSGAVDALRIPKDTWFVHQVMWDGWDDIEKQHTHIIGHWNYINGVVKDINVVSTAAYVELFTNGVSLGYGTESLNFLFTWHNVAWSPGTLQAVGYDSAGIQTSTDTRVTTGLATAIRLTPILDPTGWKADGQDIAMYDVEVVDAQGRRCPTNFDMINFTLNGPAEWRGGLGVRSDTVAGDNYILSTNLPVECGINRVLVRSMTKAGTVTLTATADGLTSATTNLNTIPFAVTNGLAAWLPGDGIPVNYSRGPTPLTQSFQPARVAIGVSNITAGAASTTLSNSIDDNETTSWTSSSTLGQNWIQYTLVRTALVSQVVIKFQTPPRNGIYPISIQVGNTMLYNATTPATTGYLTIDVTPTLGNTVRISRTTAGSFPIMEVEFYEAVVIGTPPATPTGLTATPVSSTQINLAWTDNATNELGYKIEHSTDGVNFTQVANPPLNTTHYSDTGLTPLTTYYYRVFASNAAGDSTNATTSAATLAGPPAAPTGLTATPDDTQVSLFWNPSGSATNYVLSRSTNGSGPFTMIASLPATTWLDTNVVNGVTYYYVVHAVNANGPSADSAPANATPIAGISGIFWISTTTTAAQNWNANSNWSNGTGFPNGSLAAAVVSSSIAADQTVNLNQPITVGELAVGAGGGSFNIAGNGGALTFDNATDDALLVQTAASQGDTISAPLTNNVNLEVQVNPNDSDAPLTFSGVIGGGGNITLNGDVTLSGANTFSGGMLLTNGTLELANPLALQGSTLNYSGGDLAFNGITTATLGGLSGANSEQELSLLNEQSLPVTLTVGANNATTIFGGQLSGPSSLIKVGTGSLTISNATYTGNTTIAAASGNLTVAGGSFGSGSATVTLGVANALTMSGGTAMAGNLNIGIVGGQTGASGLVGGNASANFNALTMGASGNTAGGFTINTTGSASLGTVAVRRDAGAVTTPSPTLGLIISNGNVTAASVTIAQAGVAGRGVDLNINGGSLTIADSSSTGKFAINSSAGNGFVTMTGGVLTYLGTDGLLASVGAGVSAVSIHGGTATLSGVTLNSGNAAGVTSSLVVSNGGTLYLGGVGLVLNQPSATVSAAFGNGGATVGAIADWSSIAPITLTGATTFKAADVSSVAHNISLGGVLSGAGGLTGTGGGTLTLNGTNTYSGATTVSAGKLSVNGSLAADSAVTVASGGTLGGTGVISGPATVQSGGTLAPGNSIGTLTFSNSLSLAAGCTNFFEITQSPLTNDVAKIFSALTNGGTLIVTNIGVAALTNGDSFKLFNAVSYGGAFANVILPSLPAGLGWNTNALNTSGTLSVVIITKPVIGTVSISGGGLALAGTGGVANANFYLLGTTNLASPLTNWTRLFTNQFDGNGNFNFTNPLGANAQNFYLLQLR
jgi:beta-galactosidase